MGRRAHAGVRAEDRKPRCSAGGAARRNAPRRLAPGRNGARSEVPLSRTLGTLPGDSRTGPPDGRRAPRAARRRAGCGLDPGRIEPPDRPRRRRVEPDRVPSGKVLYETAGHVSHPRFSPKGDAIAFFDHELAGDDRGSVAVLDLAGKKRMLSTGWESVHSLAWSPSGDEIWFSASGRGPMLGLHAVTLSGKTRPVTLAPGAIQVHDLSREGRALVTRDTFEFSALALAPGAARERNISWLEWSIPATSPRTERQSCSRSRRRPWARTTRSVFARRTARLPCGSGKATRWPSLPTGSGLFRGCPWRNNPLRSCPPEPASRGRFSSRDSMTSGGLSSRRMAAKSYSRASVARSPSGSIARASRGEKPVPSRRRRRALRDLP